VILDDHEWRKPKLDMQAQAGNGADDLVEYHYPGSYFDAPGQGKPVATARLDRYRIESKYAVGSGSIRLLGAGSVFTLLYGIGDHDGEYLVTSIDVRGEQQGVISLPSDGQSLPWEAHFELARRGAGQSVEESFFRPARTTAKPRIRGLQTAIVTADPGAPGAEVNVGGPDGINIGCVRVRFRWDTETARLAKEPSSHWVRVSQIFAGAGEGAVFHPRVGDEVLVDFDDGDPDRPVVSGRVYNGAKLPAHTAPPVSSMKSLSTPGGGTYNEIMYDDAAGGELLHYYAGKDQTTDVANMRRESVVSNATMHVGANNSETIGASRTESVGANDTLVIGVNQDILIGGNATTRIGANHTHTVGANEANTVGVSQLNLVGGNVTETVGAMVTESYGASRKTNVAGAVTEHFSAAMSVNVGGNVDEKCASHSLDVASSRFIAIGGSEKNVIGGANKNTVGSVILEVSGGTQDLTVTGNITRTGPLHLTASAYEEDIKASKVEAEKSSTSISVISLEALGMTRDVTGISKSKSGASPSAWGFEHKANGGIIKLAAVGILSSGIDINVGALKIDL
jgi:type VI secretion system secreted protein VgrG